jgi:hypothetical protein
MSHASVFLATVVALVLSLALALPLRTDGRHRASPPPGFTLWSDDFEGLSGNPSTRATGCTTRPRLRLRGCPDQWGTFEIESMSTSPKNVSLDGQGHCC